MGRMAIGFVGAYILGRMKRFKLAIAWFGLMTGYKLSLSPQQLLEYGSKAVASSPQLQLLVAALRGPLVDAATKAATNQLGGLADHLTTSVDRIGSTPERATGKDSTSDSPGDDNDNDVDSTDNQEATDDEHGRPRRRASRSTTPANRTTSRQRRSDAVSEDAGPSKRPSGDGARRSSSGRVRETPRRRSSTATSSPRRSSP